MDASIPTPTYRTELQRILREEGRRQDWLAKQVGVHESHISRIVHGLHCSDDLKQKIADALRRQVTEVFPS